MKRQIQSRRPHAFATEEHVGMEHFTGFDRRAVVELLFRNQELCHLMQKKVEEVYPPAA